MRPVRTARSNFTFTAPEGAPEVHDLHCEVVPGEGVVASVWALTPAERAAIAAGANVKLWVWSMRPQPAALEVAEEPGIGDDAPGPRDRLDAWRPE